MRNEINLTDEQIEARFQDFGHSICVEDLTFTRETLADFDQARSKYAQGGMIDDKEDDAIAYKGVQVAKGMPRVWMVVVDFGDVRAVAKL